MEFVKIASRIQPDGFHERLHRLANDIEGHGLIPVTGFGQDRRLQLNLVRNLTEIRCRRHPANSWLILENFVVRSHSSASLVRRLTCFDLLRLAVIVDLFSIE